MNETIKIELPEEDAALLTQEAERRGESPSATVRDLLHRRFELPPGETLVDVLRSVLAAFQATAGASPQSAQRAPEEVVTLEDVVREIRELRREVQELKEQRGRETTPIRRFAGCFTGDEQWAEIHEEIERQRRIPDPGWESS